jgi:ABC-type lipoprotein export system ATPase subunit
MSAGTSTARDVAKGQTLVELQHVYKIYRVADTGVVALGGVDLDVTKGEFLALVGPSGSGKSTILNLVGGLDRATAGTVEVGSRDLGRIPDQELTLYRREEVGFLWQGTARNLVPYLNLRQNVEVPLLAAQQSRWVRRKRVAELLDLVGLAGRSRHFPWMLSGGEQQRAAVAVAIANLPSVLLADEPTAELDSVAADRVLTAFRDAVREFGTTVLMVTHDLLAAARADRTVRLRDGRVRHEAHGGHVDEEGVLQLPAEAAAALAGADLEVEIADGEVRLRKRREGRHG